MALSDLFPWTPRTGDPDPKENFSTLGKWLGILKSSYTEAINSLVRRVTHIETRMAFDLKSKAKAYYTSQWPTFAQLLTAIGSTEAVVYVNSTVTLTANTTVPANVSIRDAGGLFVLGNYNLTINGPFDWGLRQAFDYTGTGVVTLSKVKEFYPQWWGAVTGGTESYTGIMGALNAAAAIGGGTVGITDGTFYYGTKITLDSVYNGITIRGRGRFSSILRYTGSSDGFALGGNINGFDLVDVRLYSTTGRDAISITEGTATATPDAGVLHWSNVDIRGWLRHGIKGRLTVDIRTDHLEIVQNGGCGVYVENANPYRSTTWTDTGSWMHENGGHGIALKGTFTHTFSGTISDSNTGLSTDVDTISCAGYTLIGGGAWVNCVEADIGKSVTQGGVTVGTLAHYDNTDQHMIINCTTIPSGTGALAVTTGTGSAASSTFRKNSHGLYAARSAYLNIQGGHYENHQYGIFLDAVYQSTIMPGYFLTQGTGAWGLYLAGRCRRIVTGGFGADVQSGGAGDVYFGILSKGIILHGGHGATGYTFTNRSLDAYILTSEDDNPIIMKLKSTSAQPVLFESSHATAAYIYAVNTSTTGDMGYSLSVNGWTLEFYLQQSTGDVIWKSVGQGKYFGLYGSGGDRSDQRLFWATSDGQKVWSIGPTTGQMTGSDAEANLTEDRYDDAGTLIGNARTVNRATGQQTMTGTLGTPVLSLKSTATNDDPEEKLVQGRIATTDATVTTIHAFAIPSDTVMMIKAMVQARQTGGSGTTGHGASYEIAATYRNIGGAVTLIGSVEKVAAEDNASWDADFGISTTNALLRVTGEASKNITWHMTSRTYQVGS